MRKKVDKQTKTLADYGEFALIRDIILPTVGSSKNISQLGDDCAFVNIDSAEPCELVVTTDVAPRPLAWFLGDETYRTWGWYAVTVNVSDLASTGAEPLALTTSIDAPADMAANDFEDFFVGLSEGSRAHDIGNAGGNVRTAPRFACHATALGLLSLKSRIGRGGAQVGDLVVNVGSCGLFATAYLRAKHFGLDSLSDEETRRLCRPVAYHQAMQKFVAAGVVRAASDNSDGVLGALWNIAEVSDCAMELDFELANAPDEVSKVANEFGYDPYNLMMFWGDWQVIVVVAKEQVDTFWSIARTNSIPVIPLGTVSPGPPELVGIRDGQKHRLRLVRNENFVQSSFNANILENVEYMLTTQLLD